MNYKNVNTLRQAIVGKSVVDVKTKGCHGMILTLVFDDKTTLDICTYDDGTLHSVDDFYVALNGEEL